VAVNLQALLQEGTWAKLLVRKVDFFQQALWQKNNSFCFFLAAAKKLGKKLLCPQPQATGLPDPSGIAIINKLLRQ
jgi:hypothetical protein